VGPDIFDHVSEADPHPQYQPVAVKGLANGYASLDAAGIVPASELPQADQTNPGIVSVAEMHGFAAPDLFGTGADANVTISTGTYTMTRDIDCENLTIAAGAILDTAGFRVRVLNTLTWNGTISCNGTDASGAAPGTGGGGGGTASSYATGTNGGAGVTEGAGAGSTANNGNWGTLHGAANTCRGGAGGSSGGGQAGGTAGTTTAPPTSAGSEHAATWDTGYLHGNTVVRLKPGTGGGGGGATSNATSGAGGGGGGVCAVFARRIDGSGGAHTANGGMGGNGSLSGGTGAGSGGGGGGGIVICRYMELLSGASLPCRRRGAVWAARQAQAPAAAREVPGSARCAAS
jgi:hypothetical protein